MNASDCPVTTTPRFVPFHPPQTRGHECQCLPTRDDHPSGTTAGGPEQPAGRWAAPAGRRWRVTAPTPQRASAPASAAIPALPGGQRWRRAGRAADAVGPVRRLPGGTTSPAPLLASASSAPAARSQQRPQHLAVAIVLDAVGIDAVGPVEHHVPPIGPRVDADGVVAGTPIPPRG